MQQIEDIETLDFPIKNCVAKLLANFECFGVTSQNNI